MSIPVAAMQPARPRRDRRKPTTWHVVVDMALARVPSDRGLRTCCAFLLCRCGWAGCAPEPGCPNQMVALSSWCLLTVFSLDSSVSLLVQGHYFFIC